MNPVAYAWVIPALPLLALVIILFVTRPLDVAAQRRAGLRPAGGGGAHGGHGAHDVSHVTDEQGSQADTDDHGHGGHGGQTTTWGLIGSIIGVTAMVLAFALSIAIFIQFFTTPSLQAKGYDIHLWNWFTFGNLTYSIDFRVDPLTVVMLIVVTSVSMLVHLYSIGYLAGDLGYSRFFIELALFTVSMLILVLGANVLVLFIGWELVGLSSYLLIGFWYDAKPTPENPDLPYPPSASLKAFVTTRFGDFGMLIGILILFFSTGTFSFATLNNPATYQALQINQFTVTLAMILIFAGAVGKSAQFPLHVWLPDAMAGPTPVSALIHAATMVAAGVYLVARFFPLYYQVAGPQSLEVVGYVGGFTALFAATIALTQNDIKKGLAYSTVSQLGYMFVGLAVAPDNSVGIFHLFTHAFFKALLFLGSGAVIHAVGQQDMRKMGGLAKFMPITAFTFLLATLSISGFPLFSGFWSKDPIIGTAFEYGAEHGYWLYGMTVFTAFLTAFYMFRIFFMTFGGRGGAFGGLWGGQQQFRGEGHPHEAPLVMTLPLMILAVPAVFAGFWGVNNGFANFLTAGAVTSSTWVNALTDPLTWFGVGLAFIGIALAWLMYGLEVIPAKVFTGNPLGKAIYTLLLNKYYVDELYSWIIKYIVLGLSSGAELFDKYVVDGIVNGSAATVKRFGDATRRTETGRLQTYGAAIFGGALLIMLVLFFATGAFGK
jgi:NADH-quinone oxidoreductase subunit L